MKCFGTIIPNYYESFINNNTKLIEVYYTQKNEHHSQCNITAKYAGSKTHSNFCCIFVTLHSNKW